MTTKAVRGVLVQNEAGVSLITLNEPERRNALSPAVVGGLIQAMRDAEADNDIHCVVITGSGRAFCGGGDVAVFKNLSETDARPLWSPATREASYGPALRGMSKPVIAAVNGAAVGAGFQMTLMCDIRIASEKARFGALWVARGLNAAGGAAFYLPRTIGLSNAFYMFYTGEMIDAATAFQWQLVTKVLPPDELVPYTMDLAKRIASQPIIPLAMNRRLVHRALDSSYEAIAEWQNSDRMICYQTEDHQESNRAFFEKRPPVFKGK